MFGTSSSSSKLRGQALHRRITWVTGAMFMLFGYDAGVLGGVQGNKYFLESIGNPTGAYTIAWVASSYTLAAFAGAILTMFIGWSFGRKNSLYLGNGLVIVGGAIQAASYSVAQIVVARCICGLGIGLISSTVPMFEAEISIDETKRGRATCLTCSILIFGIPLAYWIAYGFSFVDSSAAWRTPIALQCVFAIVSIILFIPVCDSPRWLFGKGRTAEAEEALSRLYDLPIDHPILRNEKAAILADISLEEAAPKLKLVDFIYDRSDLKVARRLVISFWILSLQQLMGINVLVYFANQVFLNVGIDAKLVPILAAVLETIYWAGTVPTIWLVDRWGRRNCMFWSACCLTPLMGIFIGLSGTSHQTLAVKWAAVGIIMAFNFILGFGWIGVCWLYAPEIAPLEYRHGASAANASGEWIWSFVTVFASPIALAKPGVGYRIWYLYLVGCVAACIFSYFLPETKGLKLEEINGLFLRPEVFEKYNQNKELELEKMQRELGAGPNDVLTDDKMSKAW